MTDVFTKEKRSWIMSRIRSKGTKQERKIHNFLKAYKIRHKMYPKIFGNPDVLISDGNLVVFIDGCFWHNCKKCFRKPKSNVKYWRKKIRNNAKRDLEVTKKLNEMDYKVVRLWEHQVMSDTKSCIEEIKKAINL